FRLDVRMRPAILPTTRTDAGMLQGRNGSLEAGIIGAVDTVVIPALCQFARSAQQTFLGFGQIHRWFTHSRQSIRQGTGQWVGVCSAHRMVPEKSSPVCQPLESRSTAEMREDQALLLATHLGSANWRLGDKRGDLPVPGKNRHTIRHLFCVFARVYGD